MAGRGSVAAVTKRAATRKCALPDEAGLSPGAGQDAGPKKWRKIAVDTASLDFTRLLGQPEDEDFAAFAFTNVYSPSGGKFRINLTTVGKMRLWINGKPPASMGHRMVIELNKGWNRLLLRVTPGEKQWYVVPVIRGQGNCQYDESGIAWRTQLPGTHPAFYGGGMGAGAPIVIGDRTISAERAARSDLPGQEYGQTPVDSPGELFRSRDR